MNALSWTTQAVLFKQEIAGNFYLIHIPRAVVILGFLKVRVNYFYKTNFTFKNKHVV